MKGCQRVKIMKERVSGRDSGKCTDPEAGNPGFSGERRKNKVPGKDWAERGLNM